MYRAQHAPSLTAMPKPPKIPESVLVVIHTPGLDVLLIERADRAGFWQSVTGSKDTLDEPLAAMGAREAGLIIDLVLRLKEKGGLSIVMIMHNYAQTLDIADRVMLMQRGRVTYEKEAASTSVAELMDIVRREYRAMRGRAVSCVAALRFCQNFVTLAAVGPFFAPESGEGKPIFDPLR